MRTITISQSKKPIIYVVALAVLIIVIVSGALKVTDIWPFAKHVAVDPDATRLDKTTHPTPKNNNPPTKQSLTKSPTGNQTSNQVPVDSSFVATITQLTEAGNDILFTATVQNTTTAGTCVVTFSNPNDRPVTEQFTATNESGASTCGPRTIPANEFSYLGDWQVDFHYYVGDTQATAQGSIAIH